MLIALQALSILLIAIGTGLVALLLAATPVSGNVIHLDSGFFALNIDIGFCWAAASAFITAGVLTLALTTIAGRGNWNARIRRDVQDLIREGKYGEARIRSQNIRGFINVGMMTEAIDAAQKGAAHEGEPQRAHPT